MSQHSPTLNKRTFAIGDIQGCYDEFILLLEKLDFNPVQDELWIAGDLINRGPKSLETLRHIYSIRDSVKVILGNHDLHFLAIASKKRQQKKSDTFNNIFSEPDANELIQWLQMQPLIHHDEDLGYIMTHAGIPPIWSIEKAKLLADEVHQTLISSEADSFFEHMYGNHPEIWSDSLVGMERLRTITNYFTRMRFCTKEGEIDLLNKRKPREAPSGFKPWFELRNQTSNEKIIFGHWAALMGKVSAPNIFGIDTGCVWGESLTAIELGSDRLTQQKSSQPVSHK